MVELTTDSELELLADSLRTAMNSATGVRLDAALTELGWLDMLDEIPQSAIPLVFRLLGETGAHASVLNDVVLHAAGSAGRGTVPLPFAGGCWVRWERSDQITSALDDELPLRRDAAGDPLSAAALAAGGKRWAGGWSAAAGRCCHWPADTR